jgi:hypothetical protein
MEVSLMRRECYAAQALFQELWVRHYYYQDNSD